jgi:uncharacterized protein DUF4956
MPDGEGWERNMSRVLDNVVVRLFAYYAVLVAIFDGAFRLFPWLSEAVARERARGVAIGALDASRDVAFGPPEVPITDPEALVPILVTLVGALALALPVALVYQWTREPEGYRRDFGRALVALPIAVGLAVFLVKNSLALAFSLGGIAAAIRWRSALRETMDGAFVFVVIAIGLAAGVQLLAVAFVGSVLFNVLILTLTRTRYAARPRQLAGWTLTPPVQAAAAEQRRAVALSVDVTDQSRAEARLEAVFALCAKKWERTGAAPLPGGNVRLEYRATLKKKCTVDALRAAVQSIGEPDVGNVQLGAQS